jgi:hypothetical protein
VKLIILFLFILYCKPTTQFNSCDFRSETFKALFLSRVVTNSRSQFCNLQLGNPSSGGLTVSRPIISNLVNNSNLQTGFMIGTAGADATSVEVSLDNGDYKNATGTRNWRFAFPIGSATWRDFSRHTISVRARNGNSISEIQTIRITKLQNKDINGDGFSDTVTSAVNFLTDRGRVYIYYGGLNKTGVASANVSDRTITGSTANLRIGESIVLSDFNGDGFADLAFSSTESPAPRIFLFYSTGIEGISASQTNHLSANRIILGQAAQFGLVLASGDINGDGFSDLITADISSTAEGRAYIFNGSQNGISQTSASAANTIISGESTTFKTGDYLTTGDFNGDGFSDLVVGAYNTTNGSRTYIFHSQGQSGISTMNASFANRIIIESSNIEFGYALATGDFNGDGFSDLLIGANDFDSSSTSGRAFLYLSTGSAGIVQTVSTSANLIINGENSGDRIGDYLSFADLNNDGFAELILGASRYIGGASNGRVYIYSGSATNPGNVTINANTITNRITGTGGGRLGAAMGIIDFNGDGFSDLANTANAFNLGLAFDGRFYIYYNNKSNTFFDKNLDTNADWILNGDANTATRYGYNVSQ